MFIYDAHECTTMYPLNLVPLTPSKHTAKEKCLKFVKIQNLFSNFFFSNAVLKISSGIDDGVFNMRWELFGYLALAWIVVYFVVWKGLHNSGKVRWIPEFLSGKWLASKFYPWSSTSKTMDSFVSPRIETKIQLGRWSVREQDFFKDCKQGKWNCFAIFIPRRGQASPWLCGII